MFNDIDMEILGELEKIASPHVQTAVKLFEKKRIDCASEDGLWYEFIYCILAGSQVPIETANRAFTRLKEAMGLRLRPNELCGSVKTSLAELDIVLKNSGYRYHSSKSSTILSAACFFAKSYKGNPKEFLQLGIVQELEKELQENIFGVGKKISNHWLRNVGMDTCTIDLHLKRLFNKLSLYKADPDNPIHNKDFTYLISVIRKLADRMGLTLAETQYALWLAAREMSVKDNKQRKLNL